MIQMALFFRTLTEAELASVQRLRLVGKQRKVLEGLIASAKEHRKLRARDFDISSQHFHQILSVLQQRCYNLLAPLDPVELAAYLLSKNLVKLFYKHLKSWEARAIAEGTNDAELYQLLFEISQWVTYDSLDRPLIEHFAKQYLKAWGGGNAADELYIELRTLRNMILEIYGRGSAGDEKRLRLKSQLRRLRKQAATMSDIRVQYQLHSLLTEYYVLIERDALAGLAHLRAAEQFTYSMPSQLVADEEYALRAKYAELEFLLVDSRVAYVQYQSIWADPAAQQFVQRDYYHTIRFAEVATIQGNREHSLRILDSRIHTGEKNLFVASKMMRYIVISLLNEDLPKAHGYIEAAFKYNRGKSYTFYTDIRLRFLEVAYAYLAKDWELAAALIARAMRLINSKQVRIANSDFGYYFKFVRDVIRYRQTRKPISTKIILNCNREGHFCFFRLLLDKIGEGVVFTRYINTQSAPLVRFRGLPERNVRKMG